MRKECFRCGKPSLACDLEGRKVWCVTEGCGYKEENVDVEAVDVVPEKKSSDEPRIFAG